MAEQLHQRLKKLREQSGFTVKELSKRINVPESTYREWEYGRPLVGPPFVKISEVLKVPLTVLMTGEPSEISWIAEDLKLIELQLSNLRAKAVSRL